MYSAELLPEKILAACPAPAWRSEEDRDPRGGPSEPEPGPDQKLKWQKQTWRQPTLRVPAAQIPAGIVSRPPGTSPRRGT